MPLSPKTFSMRNVLGDHGGDFFTPSYLDFIHLVHWQEGSAKEKAGWDKTDLP
jgi:hypothetical protein